MRAYTVKGKNACLHPRDLIIAWLYCIIHSFIQIESDVIAILLKKNNKKYPNSQRPTLMLQRFPPQLLEVQAQLVLLHLHTKKLGRRIKNCFYGNFFNITCLKTVVSPKRSKLCLCLLIVLIK